MAKSKIVAILIGVIALIIIFVTAVLPESSYRGMQTAAFKNCAINFEYDNVASSYDVYRAAQNKLGLCLCQSYQQKPDTALANHIVHIYTRYGNKSTDKLHQFNNVDSIIKYKAILLDTMVLVD